MTDRLLKDRCGFSLVEVIVVLVIVAILAAFVVPAYTGYIDDAHMKNAEAGIQSISIAVKTAAGNYDLTKCSEISTDTAGGTAEEKALTAHIKKLLDADMGGKYYLRLENPHRSSSLSDILSSNGSVFCYYPNGYPGSPYYSAPADDPSSVTENK